MKLKIFFLALVMGISIWGISQADDTPAYIEWGEELREPNNTFISKVIATGKYGFYTLRLKNNVNALSKHIYIEQYSNDLKLKRSQKIKLRYKGKDRKFEDVVMLGGDLYLLTSFLNQAKKKNYLFYQKLSKSLVPSKRIVNIGEIDARNKIHDGSFDLVHSRDSSKVMIYNQLPYKKKQPERFAFRVFDNKFQELWSKDITLPYNDDKFAVEEYRIDNDGNVYLLGVAYQDRSRVRRRGKPTYQYTILAYTQDGQDFQEYKINLTDQFITDLTFRIANNGDLVCSGFYSERGNYSIKGTYFFRLNTETKEIYNKNLKAFDFDFLTEYMSDNKRRKAKKAEAEGNKKKAPELYQFSLDELVLRSDGGALLVAEQFFVFERNFNNLNPAWGFNNFGFNNGFNDFRNDFFYNYNDIIVVNIRPDGEIEWATRIPKRQETMNDGGYFSSYAMSIVRDRIYFLFNDNSRNFEYGANDNGDRLHNFNGRNSIIALSELRKDGTVTTFPLFNNRDAEIITRPKICKQIGSKKMIVYGELGRGYRFAHLYFE